MALQPIDFPFVAGQDESSNTKVLSLPRLKRAVNARCLKQNQFRKIRGTEAIGLATVDPIGISPGVAPIGPVRLFTHGDQLLAAGEGSLFTLSEAADRWEEVEDGVVATVQSKLAIGHYASRDVASCSVARTDDFTVYAWFSTKYTAAAVTSYHLHVMVTDNATGAGSGGTLVELSSAAVANINPSVKCIALGSKVSVFWGESVSSVNRIRYLDITSPTSGPYPTGDQGTNLINGGQWQTAQFFDVANHGSGYVIAYVTAGTVAFARYNASHVLQATSAAIAITGDEARVGIVGNLADGDATNHLCIVSDVSDSSGTASRIVVYGLDDDMDTVSTYTDTSEPLCIGIAFGEFGDGFHSQLAYGTADSLRVKYFTDGDLATQSGFIPNAFVCGKPIGRDGKSYLMVQYRTSQPNSVAQLVRIDPGFGAARANLVSKPEVSINRGQAVSELTTGTNTIVDAAGSVAFVDDVLHVCVPVVDRYSGPITAESPTAQTLDADGVTDQSPQTVIRIGADAWAFAFGERDRYMPVALGGYTFLGGGTVLQFDGKRLVEIGFVGYPDLTAADLVADTSGGNLADGTYTYAFVWEWPDYLGNRQQSAAKFVECTVTGGGGNGKITITGPPGLGLTLKHWRIQGGDGRPISLAIYRSRSSEEDADGGTPSLHRLEGRGDTIDTFVAPFLENNPNAEDSIGTYEDTYNSTAILLLTREPLYTSTLGASELDNVPPPPARFLVAHDDRLIGIDDTNPRQLFYTKQMFTGSGTAWNETLVIPLEEDGIALASQDGNLIVFCRHGIFTVIGRPADNTGATTGYEPPQRLSTELGCTNPRSVLATPAGTFFESTRGIHVLPRGGNNPEFIGKAVEDTLASYPVITSVCHVEAESTVLFACVDQESDPATATGRVLAYQYDIGQWFVREYAGKPVSSMVVHQGNLVLGIYEDAADCTVWREDAGWDDAEGNFVGWTIETGDLRLGGFAGMHRINHLTVLAERLGTCRLQIREQVDGGGWSQPVAWNATTTEEEFLRHYQTMRPKGTAHRFEFRELQFGDVVDSEGLAVTGVSLAATQLSGATRLAAHKMG